jgi:hypothetical protein
MTITDDEKLTRMTLLCSNNEPSELTRSIIDNNRDLINLVQKEEESGLELFCYDNCEQWYPEIVQQCRGIVFHDKQIVMRSFPYTIEFSNSQIELITKSLENIFKDCVFFDSYEGALIRMFYFGNKWYISTHRKLNAFTSKWSSKKSFGSCFVDALENYFTSDDNLLNTLPGDVSMSILERFQNSLNKDKQYMFLISHNEENRIVCEAPNIPNIFHVGTFVDGQLTLTDNVGLKYPPKLNFNNVKELCSYVNTINYTQIQGVIVFAPNNKQYKIVHDEYMNLFKIRGNEPSIKFRYLQIRTNKFYANKLAYLYPNMKNHFDEYERALFEISKFIYKSYIDRFVKKLWVSVPPEEYQVVRMCHKWHEADRKINRVSLEIVRNIMDQQCPTNLNKMIRRFLLPKTA